MAPNKEKRKRIRKQKEELAKQQGNVISKRPEMPTALLKKKHKPSKKERESKRNLAAAITSLGEAAAIPVPQAPAPLGFKGKEIPIMLEVRNEEKTPSTSTIQDENPKEDFSPEALEAYNRVFQETTQFGTKSNVPKAFSILKKKEE